MDHRQTNTQSIRHRNKRNKFLSSHSSLIIELQLWSHYHSPIIIIIIYWPDWSRSCSGGRRTSRRVAPAIKRGWRRPCCSPCGAGCRVRSPCRGRRGREEGERETTYWRFNDSLASALERDEGKKEELKEISSTFEVHSRETTATILLARKREANILKMIALQLSCLQRRQKRNGK